MPTTVPNQRVAHIHRDSPQAREGNFVQIKKENLWRAYQDLNAHGFAVFVYLAGNREGFNLAISPAAIHQTVGMPESTARDKVNELIRKGYLVQRGNGSNIYDFYEHPRTEGNTGDVEIHG